MNFEFIADVVEDECAARTNHATGWEVVVFELEDEPEEGRMTDW